MERVAYEWSNPGVEFERRLPSCAVRGCEEPRHLAGWCRAHFDEKVRGRRAPSTARGSGPLECVCPEPDPDSVGECQNRGCRRGVMPDRMPDRPARVRTAEITEFTGNEIPGDAAIEVWENGSVWVRIESGDLVPMSAYLMRGSR